MPYLTDLPDVLRSAGLPVEVMPDWLTNVHGPMDTIRTIMCHHTAGPPTGDRPSLNVVRYGRPGLDGPLSQTFLTRAGVWVVVSAGLSWHAGVVDSVKHDNYRSIGVEAEATGRDAWPTAQYSSYVRGVRAMADHYRAEVIGHKEAARPVGRKIDPNFDMNRFRDDVFNLVNPTVPLNREVKMIERTIVKGDNYFRIICPVGAASAIVGRAWVSLVAAGGFSATVAFQYSADTDNAAPGTRPVWETSGQNARRQWQEIPSGTEYIEVWVKANGDGSCLVECEPK